MIMENELKITSGRMRIINSIESELKRELLPEEVYTLLTMPIQENDAYTTKMEFYRMLFEGGMESYLDTYVAYKSLINRIINLCTVRQDSDYSQIDNFDDFFHQDFDYENIPISFSKKVKLKQPVDYIEEISAFIDTLSPIKKKEEKTTDLNDEVNTETNDLRKSDADRKVKIAFEKYVQPAPLAPPFDEADLPDTSLISESDLGEDKDPDDLSTLKIVENLPEHARKWVDRLTASDLLNVINKVTYMEYRGELENKDEFFSELVDQIKNMAIARYTLDILAGRISTIEDDEIRSEVVDYMKQKQLEIPETLYPKEECPTICEKEIDKIINRLDKGCEIELEEEVLDAVVNKLWNERDNVNIKIHNNKISLR